MVIRLTRTRRESEMDELTTVVAVHTEFPHSPAQGLAVKRERF
jgi:hypothetical protein